METAQELRERLRNEREAARNAASASGEQSNSGNDLSISSTGATVERYVPSGTNEIEPDERPVQGLHHRVRSVIGTTGNTKRKLSDLAGSLAQVNSRERSGVRRFGENNGESGPDGTEISASTRSDKSRRVGNLETLEPIPPRSFEPDTEREAKVEVGKAEGTTSARKRGRPPKQGIIQPVQQTPIKERQSEKQSRKFFTGKTLSKTEAEDLQEQLITAISDEMKLIDTAIWKLTGDPIQQPIWSDMTEKELQTITNIALRIGQKSPVMATAVRASIDGGDYISAGIVLAPRFQTTVEVIKTARKRAKTNENQSRRERLRSL